jgi:5-methylcytosine-specific restriction protein A
MSRPYDLRAWRRLSKAKLRQSPLCEPCFRAGYVEPAVLVDHIQAISDGGCLIVRLDQLQSMCVRCHNQKHGSGIKGCDADGMPIDPVHAWFKEP